jgi:hypothetical protein
MGATRAKTEYLTKVRLERFLINNLPNVWLVTMTFHENVIVKGEAMRRWKPVADYLTRHGVGWCGVWQQQKRGAWHHHFLVNKYIDVVGFRDFVVARGWGQFVNIEAVGRDHGGRRFQDAGRVVKYLTRYLTRDFSDHVPRRIRLTSGRSSNKVGTVRFQWVGGLARVWRLGCSSLSAAAERSHELYGAHGHSWSLPRWSDGRGSAAVWRAGCIIAGLNYVDVMRRILGLAVCEGG